MRLPAALRRATPAALKHSPRLRAVAVGAGLIPPRSMHSEAEAALLARLAAQAHRVMEIGVYEGGSAALLAGAMSGGELHLVDPFGEQPDALRAGWAGDARATRRVVERAVDGRAGPRLVWHIAYSQELAPRWRAPIDLLFVDGDHSAQGCRRDWKLFHGHVAPGGRVAFHDARLGRPGGRGLPGPTEVVDALFRTEPPAGWTIETEVDRTVVVRRRPTPPPPPGAL